MFVWVTLPKDVDGAALLDEALSEGVAFVPGAPFFFDGHGKSTLRLNFTAQTLTQMDEGVRRLGDFIRRLDGRRMDTSSRLQR
jgi:DNA-binding transcriptional MocR family regulator